MTKINIYPNKIEQPNANKASGLQGKCYDEVRRTGGVHPENGNCSLQKDPKYCHEWSNTENLTKGKTAQCGRPSTYHCSHATYYSIKGYRNTCPIAGLNGTYTKPATLRLYFPISSTDIKSDATINSVTISFQHRCVGVNVANGKTTTVWGPNFSGHSRYPNKKPITISFAGQDKTYNKNPPLSENYDDTVEITFKGVKYNDLKKHIDIKYGSNLSTNPGNIYIKGLKISVNYTNPSKKKQKQKNTTLDADMGTLYMSLDNGCFKGMTVNGVDKTYTTQVYNKKTKKYNTVTKIGTMTITAVPTNVDAYFVDDANGKTCTLNIIDQSMIEGRKFVQLKHKEKKATYNLYYNAVKREKPSVEIPREIEKNVLLEDINKQFPDIIFAGGGCATSIYGFDGAINASWVDLEMSNLDINLSNPNIITDIGRRKFYSWMAGLSCGQHNIIVCRAHEPLEECLQIPVTVKPTTHNLKFECEYKDENGQTKTISINDSELILLQDKVNNAMIRVIYTKTPGRHLINSTLNFHIMNPTYNKEDGLPIASVNPMSTDISFNHLDSGNNPSKTEEFPIGLYRPGTYTIQIFDESSCNNLVKTIKLTILPNHKMYFDGLFVRGEDSTAFDYDYLVALEGDTIKEPLVIEDITLGASYKDIRVCTSQLNILGIHETGYIDFVVKNTSDSPVNNLYLELNALTKDEDGNLVVTTDEWLTEDGAFNNFVENFNTYNEDLLHLAQIKNLTDDDDTIDEEDVYLYISRLEPNSSLKLKLPYGCHKEKEVFLQVLLFEELLPLYDINDCGSQNPAFTEISFEIYDSVSTFMSIDGCIDIQDPYIPSCQKIPSDSNATETETEDNDICKDLVCFKTETDDCENGITYTIRNIDTKPLDYLAEKTIIKNDPRLIPYKIKYQEAEFKVNYDPATNKYIVTEENAEHTKINLRSNQITTPQIQVSEGVDLNIDFEDDFSRGLIIVTVKAPTKNGIFSIKTEDETLIFSKDLSEHEDFKENNEEGYTFNFKLQETTLVSNIKDNTLSPNDILNFNFEYEGETQTNKYSINFVTETTNSYLPLSLDINEEKLIGYKIRGKRVNADTRWNLVFENTIEELEESSSSENNIEGIEGEIIETTPTNENEEESVNIFILKEGKIDTRTFLECSEDEDVFLKIFNLNGGEKVNTNIVNFYAKDFHAEAKLTIKTNKNGLPYTLFEKSSVQPRIKIAKSGLQEFLDGENPEYDNTLTFSFYNSDGIKKKECSVIYEKTDNGGYFKQTGIDGDIRQNLSFNLNSESSQTTNANGIVTFFIPIPLELEGTFTVQDIYDITKISIPDYKGIASKKLIDDPYRYSPGQAVPLKIEVTGYKQIFANEIIFDPNIMQPNSKDQVTIYYRTCGLPNNQGILKTTFKTNPKLYQLIPNEVSENILFGVKTDVRIYSRLEKVLVENNTVNRLYLTLLNKKRFNKQIKIRFTENDPEDETYTGLYDYLSHNVEVGSITIEDNEEKREIIWEIPYLKAEAIVKGFIDFEAKEIGLNKINIEVTDFLDEKEEDEEENAGQ